MKTALVLEGGAMRGLFTAGVIDVMMEQGIDYHTLVGVSAGSSFGCNYKSRQPGRVLRYNMQFRHDPRYMGLLSLLTTGNLVGARFAYHTLPLKLDIFDTATFESNPMKFYAVCTDVDTAQPIYYHMERVTPASLEWLRASASMPVVTRPVRVDTGHRMLDGGISDSIPLEWSRTQGFESNVVVLTQPHDYRKQPSSPRLWKMLLHSYPALAAAMIRRHEMYNAQLDYVGRCQADGSAFVIAPDQPLPIGKIDMNARRMTHVYNLGREAARRSLPALMEYLKITKSDIKQ